jgi:hypothetical protein
VFVLTKGNGDTLLFVHGRIVPTTLALLPAKMDSIAAQAMLLAIGLQESEFEARVQGGGGPARGFWQFESGGGVKGVLEHATTKPIIGHICRILQYGCTRKECFEAIAHNDVLACAFARLLLWTAPGLLPKAHEADKGWEQYLETWRPGKPHRETWDENFASAWRIVIGTVST